MNGIAMGGVPTVRTEAVSEERHVPREHHEISVGEFDLESIACSGQVFRWYRAGDVWRVPSHGDVASLRQDGEVLHIACARGNLGYWLHYLTLDDDEDGLHRRACGELSRLPEPMPELVARYGGIRVLRQDPWEAAVSFCISQNNNIPRITGIIERLCDGPDEPFPGSDKLLGLLEERDFGMGYRRPYLQDLARRWDTLAGVLSEHRGYEADYNCLLEVNGIGPKVADCICLYGLGYLNVVPRDTWIRKAERGHDIVWHPEFGGLQQQMVFEWVRTRRRGVFENEEGVEVEK